MTHSIILILLGMFLMILGVTYQPPKPEQKIISEHRHFDNEGKLIHVHVSDEKNFYCKFTPEEG